MRVRMVDLGICDGRNARYLREMFDTMQPDEVVWVSGVPKPFDHAVIEWQPYPYAQCVFPVLDRWSADRYRIAHAPLPPGWQLQVHCLPLGAEWFREYVADLKCRFPAFTGAVLFGMEACEWKHEAAEAMASLGIPWCACAGAEILGSVREYMAHGMVSAIVSSDIIDAQAVIDAKLRGLIVHGTGFDSKRALTVPLDSFTKVEAPKQEKPAA